MSKYSHISDVNIIHAASIGSSDTPPFITQRFNKTPEPEPSPVHPTVQITRVSAKECAYDALHPVGITFPTHEYSAPTNIPPNNSYCLWDTHMFPSHELANRSISPSTILQLLEKRDASTFTTPITHTSSLYHHFRLNVDGGANRSITKNL